MNIEVVRARPGGADVVRLTLPPGATVRDALQASGLDFEDHRVGVFGKRLALDHALSDGDRVEIYRALALDPKEARRRRANRGRSPNSSARRRRN